MAMTQKDIDELIDKVKAGTYTIEDALKEIADSAKGKDVRKALYALGYTLNQEGKAGSVDLMARKELESKASKAELNAETSERKQEIAVERSRIDNLSKMEEGSTTGDAELQDIRAGADGTVYPSAGEAVRGQIGDIGRELIDFEKVVVSDIRVQRKHQVGMYITPEIEESYTDHAVNSIAYPSGKYKVLRLVSDTVRYSYQARDIQGNTITGSTFLNEDTTFESEYDFYITLMKSQYPASESGDITDSDLTFIDNNLVVTRIINENGNTMEDRVKELEGSAVSLDETLTEPAKAAPADAVGKLKGDISYIFDNEAYPSIWESGTWDGWGNKQSDSARIRTKANITNQIPDKLITGFETVNGYECFVLAYDLTTNEFAGYLTADGTFDKYGNAVFLKKYSFNPSLNYVYKLVARDGNNPSGSISVDGANNIILINPIMPKVLEDVAQNEADIDEVRKSATVPSADIPNISSTKVSGYSIGADGSVFANNAGCYYKNIETESGKSYKIRIDNEEPSTSNTRVHGYSGDTWVEQIALFSQVQAYSIEGTFTIPSDSNIDNIRISADKYSAMSLKPYPYTIIDFIKDRAIFNDATQYVNMGNPYTYLSAPIEDEILDSTTVDDVYAIYDSLVTNYPQFIKRMPDIGYDESGLPMRLYRVGWQEPWMVGTGNEASWSDANNIYSSEYDYQKLFVNAGTHGNEKSSVYGVALSIQEIVTSQEQWALYLRGNFMIDVCPVANPWGYNNTSRNGYGDVNINRDFLTRTRSESQAIYNLLKDGGYHACIDSHNSGGNANYFGITDTNPLLKTYVQMNMKLAGIVYDSWETLASGDVYAVKPYMQCWVSEPLGMLQDLFNELGLIGYLIESVGVYKNGIGVLTPNHKKYCKFTKDLLINSLIALGSTNWE